MWALTLALLAIAAPPAGDAPFDAAVGRFVAEATCRSAAGAIDRLGASRLADREGAGELIRDRIAAGVWRAEDLLRGIAHRDAEVRSRSRALLRAAAPCRYCGGAGSYAGAVRGRPGTFPCGACWGTGVDHRRFPVRPGPGFDLRDHMRID